MSTLTIILLITVAVICLKWLLVVLLYPLQSFYCMHLAKKEVLMYKILAKPYSFIEKKLRGGGERFTIFNISTIPSRHLRKWLYKGLGVKMGRNVVLHFKTEIRSPYNLVLGKGTIIGDNAVLDARMGLVLGDNVNLSSNVSIWTLQHDHRDPNFACSQRKRMNVEIGERAWLGCNVIVLPGVRIGEGAVCCAGCVVTKDVEPYTVVAGIPAKKVGERPKGLVYEFDGKSCHIY
ncbi:DapH/DapD/GlmU-related protein [Bacteroides acidifaciens]|uniref:acyltransferase n=1 Tax=Bacteroides acidifaciens TaxID=85831 RepID=UPI0023BC3F96|nr:acyltransferase [Bacteroides acidifaciens]MDE6821792.1 acyltransferase [Bacteroides acidifaciens]